MGIRVSVNSIKQFIIKCFSGEEEDSSWKFELGSRSYFYFYYYFKYLRRWRTRNDLLNLFFRVFLYQMHYVYIERNAFKCLGIKLQEVHRYRKTPPGSLIAKNVATFERYYSPISILVTGSMNIWAQMFEKRHIIWMEKNKKCRRNLAQRMLEYLECNKSDLWLAIRRL